MIKRWERYILRELCVVFVFFIACFFSLYAILDYSTHTDDFVIQGSFRIFELLNFYRDQFFKRLDLLLPLSLTIATIKVLTIMNQRREWMVLQTAGISNRRLLRPILLIATACTLINWANFEWFLPSALARIEEFHTTRFKHSRRAKRKELIHLLSLKDQSKLIYQTYDTEKDAFFDVFWIRSQDNIWRMKFLSADPAKPVGQWVDHLVRNEAGVLEKIESFPTYTFSDLHWRPSMLGKAMIPFENLAIHELLRLRFRSQSTTPYNAIKITTQLCHKGAIPLLSIIAVIGVAPFCIRFSRNSPILAIYALALFFLLAFYMITDAGVILGENGVIPPVLALFSPIAIIGIPLLWRFKKATI